MPKIVEVTDLSAPELAVYARLTEAQLRSRRHPEEGLFIAESETVIGHALDAGYVPVSLLMERRQLAGASRLLARCGDIPVYTAGRETLSGLTGYALTRGVLCAMRRPAPVSPTEVVRNARRLAVLEGITDAANVGAIFRSAAALGADGVLLSPGCCDPLVRRAVRVSMGTVFQIPWAWWDKSLGPWPQSGLDFLKNAGFYTVALALSARAVSIDSPGLRTREKLALLLGTEGTGLTPDTIAACDVTAVIPMENGVDSLNVAAASAVAFWALRERT